MSRNHDDWAGLPFAGLLRAVPESLLKVIGVALVLLIAYAKASAYTEVLGLEAADWVIGFAVAIPVTAFAILWAKICETK